MSKTKETLEIEKELLMDNKMGRFNCSEVTIGNQGIVDILRYEKATSKKEEKWICFEIKVSVSDFNSKQKKTFVGNYNYYAMTKELYAKVKNKIPENIGVYVFPSGQCAKRAKYRELIVDRNLLFYSMMRSMKRINQEYLVEKYYNINRSKKIVKEKEKKIEELKHTINYNKELEETFFDGDFLEMLAFCNDEFEFVYFIENNIIYRCKIIDYNITLNKKELFLKIIDASINHTKLTDIEKQQAISQLNLNDENIKVVEFKDFNKNNNFFQYRHQAILAQEKIKKGHI